MNSENQNEPEKTEEGNQQSGAAADQIPTAALRKDSDAHQKNIDFINSLKLNSKVTKTLLDLEAVRTVAVKSVKTRIEKFKEEQKSAKQFSPVTKFKKASPCSSKWDEMDGSGNLKYCQKCQLMVYDFRSVEQEQAEQIVKNREQIEKCTLYRRNDGKFLAKDCPVGMLHKRAKVLVFAVPSIFLLVAVIGMVYLAKSMPKESIANGSKDKHPSNKQTASVLGKGKMAAVGPDGELAVLSPESTQKLDRMKKAEFIPAGITANSSIPSGSYQSPSASFSPGFIPASRTPLKVNIQEPSELFKPAAGAPPGSVQKPPA